MTVTLILQDDPKSMYVCFVVVILGDLMLQMQTSSEANPSLDCSISLPY